MTVRRFLRSVRVTVGDADSAVKVEDLYIRFRIKREATASSAEGTIDIYNLNESNETRIHERAVRVVLEAGYQDRLATIIDGRVRRVERERVDLDRITRIHIGGHTADAEAVGSARRSIFMRTYEGTVQVRDIVRDGVEHMMLEIGNVDLIPEDEVETDFKYNGSTQIMLTERLRPLGLEWYEDNGVIRFSRFGKSADDRDGIVISERTGMIGTPTVTDDGIRVRTMLDARMQLDTLIRVESSVLDKTASGDAANERAVEIENRLWKIIEVEHVGDNREGDFASTVEGRPVS